MCTYLSCIEASLAMSLLVNVSLCHNGHSSSINSLELNGIGREGAVAVAMAIKTATNLQELK